MSVTSTIPFPRVPSVAEFMPPPRHVTQITPDLSLVYRPGEALLVKMSLRSFGVDGLTVKDAKHLVAELQSFISKETTTKHAA